MGKRKLKLAWIPQNAIRRTAFRKRRASLLEKVRQLSILCDVKACAIIYDPDEPKDQKPETWPSEEETKTMLSMEQGKSTVNREEYLRQWVAKLEDQHNRIHSKNMETLLTIFLHNCVVGEKSLNDLGTVDEAECMMRVIELKMKAVKDRIEKIGKGKMVTADMAEDGREHDSNCEVNGSNYDLFGSCYGNNGDGGLREVVQQQCFNVGESSSWMETMMMDADYNCDMAEDGREHDSNCEVNGSNYDLFGSCYGNNGDGGLREVVQQQCFNVGESSSWMETMMMDADYNNANGNDDFFQSCVGNGNGGLDGMIRQSGFNVGESSSLMGPSSAFFLD